MFNKRLRETRMERMLTQQTMANALHIALRTYQCYEQGTREPPLSTLVAIADIFHVTTDYLLCRDPLSEEHADEYP